MKKITANEFLERAEKIYGINKYQYINLFDIKNFSMQSLVKIFCPIQKHGLFEKKATSHIHQKAGCPKCTKEKLSLNLRRSFEDFKKQSEKIHGKNQYDYSKVKNCLKNNKTKVPIICNKQNHGIFWQTPDIHINQKAGCQKCAKNKKLSIEEIEKRCRKIHNNKYAYNFSTYNGTKQKMEITCPIHGLFLQRPVDHLKGHGCEECGGTKKLTKDEIIKKANEIHNFKYDYSLVPDKIINNLMKISIICKEHGVFNQTISGHVSQKHNCPSCSGVKKLTKEDIITKAKQKHGEKTYDYSLVSSKIINNKSKINIICMKHGVFKQSIGNHINIGQGCPKCFQGKLSKIQQEFFLLLNKKIKSIELEKTIKINNKRYYADIYFPEKKMIIEYNGDYWHANPKKYKHNWIQPKTKLTAKEIWKKDEERQKLLEKNGYKIITIWESEYKKNKKEIIENILHVMQT